MGSQLAVRRRVHAANPDPITWYARRILIPFVDSTVLTVAIGKVNDHRGETFDKSRRILNPVNTPVQTAVVRERRKSSPD
jgi:hypothetical protein